MIRHKITDRKLQSEIVKLVPGWFKLAADTLNAVPANPKSSDFTSLWGDIKPAWMTLQNSKCMFCESLAEAAISNDVEHFRPKAKVTAWKVPAKYAQQGVQVTPLKNPKGDPGYRSLAYQPWNYGCSCKVCNSILKKNYFPIVGTRNSKSKDPLTMKSEKALLIYPIGSSDTNPQKLITFVGMHPKAVKTSGHDRHRALVTIELFQLNSAEAQKELFQARALIIGGLYEKLEKQKHAASDADRDDATDWIDIYTNPRSPHSSCMQCFRDLYNDGSGRAKLHANNAKYFLQTGSLAEDPTVP